MVQRTRLIQCPSCEKQLEDTKQPNITCKYCGFNFDRADVVQEDEDYIRKKMIVDLRTDMDIYKNWKRISTIFMAVSLLLAIPVFLSVPFEVIEGVVLMFFLLSGIVLFVLSLFFDRKYESSKSKATDLSMRRRL